MDLEEWEYLPDDDDGFLDYHERSGGGGGGRGSEAKNSVFNMNMNYFICPSPKSHNEIAVANANPKVPKPLEDEIIKETIITSVIKPPPIVEGGDQDMVSQVFFKKENEFVDMKMDSPKSNSRGLIMPPMDSGNFKFDEKTDSIVASLEEEEEEEGKEKENSCVGDGGLNLWKLGLSGIGAICSAGVAAATIGILIFGNRQKNKTQSKLRFQIYTDEKRIKQVVHHATKLNEAISAASGVPLTKAHITFGGYHDAI